MKIDEVVHRPEYLLARHRGRQDRIGWRRTQQKRYDRETEMADDDRFRHIAKSQARYQPNTKPLIRFGLFRQHSQTFLMSPEPPEDERYDPDWQFARNEVGVSCYEGYWHGSYWQVLEPMTNRASYNVTRPFAPIYKFGKQMLDYMDHGKPMDVFLIYGHLKSFGKSQEMLSLGADGEYLLDTSQPYTTTRLNPDIVYIERLKLADFFIWLYGSIDRLRSHFADEDGQLD